MSGNAIEEEVWYTSDMAECAYVYKITEGVYHAYIRYQWDVPARDFPTREEANEWVSKVCR